MRYFGLVEKKAYPLHPQRLEVLLEPRSLLVMSGDAYELYVHRIGHVKVRRVNLSCCTSIGVGI